MLNMNSPFSKAAVFVFISALLHLFAFLVGGFTPDATWLIGPGILYLFFTFGLLRSWRWLAYVVMFVLIIGIGVASGESFGPSTVPSWWWIAIALADLVAVVFIFVNLWHQKQPAPI